MGLTVAEKEHWKDRIGRKIDKKIETILASEPNLMERVDSEAYAQALESLGLTQLQAEWDAAEKRVEELQKREQHIKKEMLALVKHVPLEQLAGEHIYQDQAPEVSSAIEKRQAVYSEQILAREPLGQQILQLRREKEELLDTVWLAVSSNQIKELWKRVSAVLGEEPTTPLQTAALAIEPVKDE